MRKLWYTRADESGATTPDPSSPVTTLKRTAAATARPSIARKDRAMNDRFKLSERRAQLPSMGARGSLAEGGTRRVPDQWLGAEYHTQTERLDDQTHTAD
jgi:hypothetical protein